MYQPQSYMVRLNCYKITVKSQDGKMRENTSVAYP